MKFCCPLMKCTNLLALLFYWPVMSNCQIQWNEWNQENFNKVKNTGQLILVDIGMEGCTACRWQDEITYANPEVIQLIQTHFFPIQVDCQARPDIGEKYSDWSWPATIIMNSNGEQVLAIAGNRRPSRFIEILEDIIQKKQNGTLEVDPNEPYAYPKQPPNVEISQMRDVVREQMDSFYNHESGGWGRQMKNNQRSGTIEQLLVRLRAEKDSSQLEQLIQTLDGMLQQIDPVWGGIFVASVGDWSSIVPEKRITTQSTALTGFAYGYQLTGNPLYIQAIEEIDRYISRFLSSPSGLFYTSQEDDAPQLPDSISAREYYRMTEPERLSFGIPPIDHAIYTDLNARMISALVKVYECTGEKKFLTKAHIAALSLLEHAKTKEGWMNQFVEADSNYMKDSRIRKLKQQNFCFLSPQAFTGKAMLDLYRVTQESRYLDAAIQIENGMDNLLYDNKLGGYFAVDKNQSHANPLRKPIEFNSMAGLFIYELSIYVQDSSLRNKANQALLSIYNPSNMKREGPILGFTSYALEMMASGYVEFVIVVKHRKEFFADEMLQEVNGQFEPRKIVQYSSPSRYPYRKRPTLYICDESRCSSPIVLLSDIKTKSNFFVTK